VFLIKKRGGEGKRGEGRGGKLGNEKLKEVK
jgi:hypothetical protein